MSVLLEDELLNTVHCEAGQKGYSRSPARSFLHPVHPQYHEKLSSQMSFMIT